MRNNSYRHNFSKEFKIIFEELPETVSTRLGPIKVTAFGAVHVSGAPSYALRVEVSGKTIVYSGDTEWTGSPVEALDGADDILRFLQGF